MAIEHLRDKGAMVRKSAANLVTLFLSHNSYSYDVSQVFYRSEIKFLDLLQFQLKLSERKQNLESVEAEIKKLEEESQKVHKEVEEEMEAKWAEIKDDVRTEVEKEFEDGTLSYKFLECSGCFSKDGVAVLFTCWGIF